MGLRSRSIPERAGARLALVQGQPGRRVEAVMEVVLIDEVVRRPGHRVCKVQLHFVGVDVHASVDEVRIVLVQVVGRHHCEDRLERRRVTHRHVNGIETTPGQPEHADLAVRIGLPREPGDHVLAVLLLLLAVLILDEAALAVARAANVNAGYDVAAPDKIGVQRKPGGTAFGLAVRQVFQQHRQRFAGMFRTRFSSSGEIDIRRETHAIAHRDPGFLHYDVVAAIGAEGNLRGREEHKQQG